MMINLVTLAHARVGHCECGTSGYVARGAIKDHALGYANPSNHPYRPLAGNSNGASRPSN